MAFMPRVPRGRDAGMGPSPSEADAGDLAFHPRLGRVDLPIPATTLMGRFLTQHPCRPEDNGAEEEIDR